MISWHKQKYILIIISSILLGKQGSLFAKQEQSINLTSNTTYLVQNSMVRQSLLAQNVANCEKLNTDYQEVYSFETDNFHISVCQQDSSFYYHRQSKTNDNNTLLIPAQSAYGGDVFQATVGKTIYFVGKNGDRYYSSVMKNNSEIVFEPEMQPSTISSDALETSNSNSSLAVSAVDLDDTAEASLKLDNPELAYPENTDERLLVCTRKKSAFHPQLDGWQKLIGKSPDIANKYALKNGHKFLYNGDASEEALIETNQGVVVNLDIAVRSETINRVCVQPVAKK